MNDQHQLPGLCCFLGQVPVPPPAREAGHSSLLCQCRARLRDPPPAPHPSWGATQKVLSRILRL